MKTIQSISIRLALACCDLESQERVVVDSRKSLLSVAARRVHSRTLVRTAKASILAEASVMAVPTVAYAPLPSVPSCVASRSKTGCATARAIANAKGATSNHGSSAQANPCQTEPASRYARATLNAPWQRSTLVECEACNQVLRRRGCSGPSDPRKSPSVKRVTSSNDVGSRPVIHSPNRMNGTIIATWIGAIISWATCPATML
jgi:hypothetical protein